MPVFARFAPLALAALLAACGTDQPAATSTDAASSAPEAKPGLALSGGRLVLPAVKGNPGAVYFTLTNGAAAPATLAAVDVAGAGMAMLHETREIAGHSEMGELADPVVPAGGTLVLAPGGKHVMVDGLPADWKAGGTVELTLVFADGDKLSATIPLEAPGGAAAGGQ
ncbi:copper chaperone PCu(A)C [Novosphingobium piscinae]|uniref:Copper chaperone PCu(A)C n=1 Tax=Novosphingobium piscinae TaxID=1507448 RepID=A0A7X1G007_9SPHN|nr:copper chaperone PCu(A)C [Novosphingobium piscinae]MBC2669452.1 copper chaperone PCu(A)C [Novosphingobium piscinae]